MLYYPCGNTSFLVWFALVAKTITQEMYFRLFNYSVVTYVFSNPQFEETEVNFLLPKVKKVIIIILFLHSSIITWNGEKDGCR